MRLTEVLNLSNEVEEEDVVGKVTLGFSLALLDAPELMGRLWPIMAVSGRAFVSVRAPWVIC